jgi:hypothetical protein
MCFEFKDLVDTAKRSASVVPAIELSHRTFQQTARIRSSAQQCLFHVICSSTSFALRPWKQRQNFARPSSRTTPIAAPAQMSRRAMLTGQGSLCQAFVRLLNSTNKCQCYKTLFIVTSRWGRLASLTLASFTSLVSYLQAKQGVYLRGEYLTNTWKVLYCYIFSSGWARL